MTRTISATNLDEINASHLHEVVLVELDFDTPVYVHSGVGTITYNTNDYLGVGGFGSISAATETEQLRPTALTLTLSGIDSNYISEALDSGNYGDRVSIYCGYSDDSFSLVDDPWLIWGGFYEFSSIEQGVDVSVSITVQHDLSLLSEKDGGRYTDEDQQSRFSGDVGFEFITEINGLKLFWGGKPVTTYSKPAGNQDPGDPPLNEA